MHTSAWYGKGKSKQNTWHSRAGQVFCLLFQLTEEGDPLLCWVLRERYAVHLLLQFGEFHNCKQTLDEVEEDQPMEGKAEPIFQLH